MPNQPLYEDKVDEKNDGQGGFGHPCGSVGIQTDRPGM